MSQKNNLLYKTYIATKLTLHSVLFTEVCKFEETNIFERIRELENTMQELIQQKRQTLAEVGLKLHEDLSNTENLEATINQEIIVLKTEFETQKNILLTELREKLKSLKSCDLSDIYKSYNTVLNNCEISTKVLNIATESNVTVQFSEERVVARFLTTYPNMFNLTNIQNILFFSKFRNLMLQSYNTVIKLKLRRWRLKKKKLRKLYILKKLKRVLIFKKVKTRHYNLFLNNRAFFIKTCLISRSILVKKIPISERLFEQYNLEFFYKLNKNTKEEVLYNALTYNTGSDVSDLVIYLRNYHQKPYWKLRKARRAHWSLFFSTTIRKQRYKKFITKYLKTYDKLSYTYTFFVNFFTKFNISWTRTSQLEAFCKRNLVIVGRNIIQLPYFITTILNWKVLQKKNFLQKKKIGRWSFLNFKRATLPWLQKKKHAPKLIKHLQPKCFFLNYISWWDVMTNSLLIQADNYNYMFPVLDEFKVNSLIKLHMYRYKSNTKCMWH